MLSDLEIIATVETEWHDDTRDAVLYMNEICEMYVSLFPENELPIPQNPQYKVISQYKIICNSCSFQLISRPDETGAGFLHKA